ncbi:MAG: GAF domain-containing protein, partial [Anaerolineales bacterium]|nr:GAF domain-containing protein [Anaerolineales bacterium]
MSLNSLLLIIELLVLGGLVLGLHYFRSRYGLTLLLVFLGGLAAAVQFSAPMGIFVNIFPEVNLTLVANVLIPVILLGILLIYITEGTAPARFAIWGIVAVVFLSLFVSCSLSYHFRLSGGGSFFGITSDSPLLQYSLRKVFASAIAFVVDVYMLAIIYQYIINRCGFGTRQHWWKAPPGSSIPIWLAVGCALIGSLWVDALIFSSITYAGTPYFLDFLLGHILGKTISGIVLWPISAYYLTSNSKKQPTFRRISQRSSFDVLFGSYGQLETALFRSEESLLRRVDELAAIHAIFLEITSTSDLQTLFEKIVETAAHLLSAPSGGLYLTDSKKDEVRCVVSYRTTADYTGVVLKYGEGSSGVVAQSGEPLIINDYRTWSDRAEIYDQEKPFSAVICVPLSWRGQVTGVLHVNDNVEERQFTSDDLKLLSQFANQAAVALENARLLLETNQSLEREKRLVEIAHMLSKTIDLPTILRDIVRLTAELIGADAGAIALLDSDESTIRFPYLHNLPDSLSERPLPEPLGATRDVIDLGESILIDNYPEFPKAIPDWIEAGVISVVGVPIWDKEKPIGALGLMGLSQETQFTQRDLVLAEAVGRQAGVAIQNAHLFAESERQMMELGAVIEASLDTSGVLEIGALLERIYHQVEQLFAPDSFAVVRFVPEENTLEILLAIEEGQKLSEWIGLQVPIEEGSLSGLVIKNKKYLLVKDLQRETFPISLKHDGKPARSWLGVPLIAHGQIFGAISVQSFQPDTYDESHCDLLETLASQIAIALMNADYAAGLKASLYDMSSLYNLAKKTSTLDADEVFTQIVENLKIMLKARAVSIALLDPKTNILTLSATAGIDDHWVQEFSLKVGEGVSGIVVETGQSRYLPDTHSDPEFRFFSEEVRSLLVVPLKTKDRIIGALSIDSDLPNAFSTHDEHLLTIAASQVAVAIENAT